MDRRRFIKLAGTPVLTVAIGGRFQTVNGKELFYDRPKIETKNNSVMKHKCKITVLKRECYKDLQEKYLL